VIGDHTDYTGGLCLPMAIDLGTTVEADVTGDLVVLASLDEPVPVEVPLDVPRPEQVEPMWGRYVAGVVNEVRPAVGLRGEIRTDLPIGAGLSSSAALELAVALALGFEGSPLELARLCQRAEQRASGVPCGILDQLTSASGVEGSLLLVDCRTDAVTPTPMPDSAAVVAVHSGQARTLAGSAYADRRDECHAVEQVLGPLRDATLADLPALHDPVLRSRARHVITENARVLAFVDALHAGDLATAGACMVESHRSLAEHFEVSTPVLDELVEHLVGTPGVWGARLTGGGFGGSVVALVDPDAEVRGWWLKPSAGALVEVRD
jgi:galactokinase